MSNKKLGTEPAFPKSPTINPLNASTMYSGCSGMSKRLWIATQVLIGCLNNPNVNDHSPEVWVKTAYTFTEELLKQENE